MGRNNVGLGRKVGIEWKSHISWRHPPTDNEREQEQGAPPPSLSKGGSDIYGVGGCGVLNWI